MQNKQLKQINIFLYNGFTLIELLAVIVILAIIALIATPIVLNIINNAKDSAELRSGENYLTAVSQAVLKYQMSNSNETIQGTWYVTNTGNICSSTLINGFCESGTEINVSVDGTYATSGKIIFTNGNITNVQDLKINSILYKYSNSKKLVKTKNYEINVTLENAISSSNNTLSIQNDSTVTLIYTFDGINYKAPFTNPAVIGATATFNRISDTEYIVTLKDAVGNVSFTIKGFKYLYSNGTEVYYNVNTGKECKSDYIDSQSNIGVKSGCMKFYAFNDTGLSTINLILDHNTSDSVQWNSNGSNAGAPITLLNQLELDTKDWKQDSLESPEIYVMDQTGQTSNSNYTIDYDDYNTKARIISAQEISNIIGYEGWDETNASKSPQVYFDSKVLTQSSTCKLGNTSKCNYGWLYDRTSTDCTLYGCNNNADSKMKGIGYWTVSSQANFTYVAWLVGNTGRYDYLPAAQNNVPGVRPVITISKTLLN